MTENDKMDKDKIITELTAICGEAGIRITDEDCAPYLVDWRRDYRGSALAVVLPASTDEVSRVLALANRNRIPVVPQGGNTGLCGAATPFDDGRAIVLGLGRMDKILDLDTTDKTITVEAGCILQTAQEAALEKGLYLPIDLGARGSCRIGGNLSTNAGGLNVLRYGNTRAHCRGIEVVLADGRCMNLMSSLKKDNTGYDLKDLFIGAEGTLGIITRAVLGLLPAPQATATAYAVMPSIADALRLLDLCQRESEGRMTAFELIPRFVQEVVLAHRPAVQRPIESDCDFCTLIEVTSTLDADARPDADGSMPLERLLEKILARALEDNMIADATIAGSAAQRTALWDIRENIPEVESETGEAYKSDVSIPLKYLEAFYHRAREEAEKLVPGVRVFGFGHLGDGNLHYNLCIPEAGHPDFAAMMPEFEEIFLALLGEYGGSISAEHGIGVRKREALTRAKDAVALEVMQGIKQLLDPNGIMNPGKIFADG